MANQKGGSSLIQQRLINAFSKKIENHAHSVALFAMCYNFVCIHKTLRNVLETWEMAGH